MYVLWKFLFERVVLTYFINVSHIFSIIWRLNFSSVFLTLLIVILTLNFLSRTSYCFLLSYRLLLSFVLVRLIFGRGPFLPVTSFSPLKFHFVTLIFPLQLHFSLRLRIHQLKTIMLQLETIYSAPKATHLHRSYLLFNRYVEASY